jgi:hypothetical protein
VADSDTEVSARTCFVAMPITTSDAYAEKVGGDRDHFKHVLDHLFKPALQAAGLKVIPPAASGSEMIQGGIIRNLEKADYVLCDLSDLNPNVFFELGIRTSLDRPVMHVRDNLTGRIPFDIAAINTHSYNSSLTPWQLDSEIQRLTAFITEVINSEKPGNEMWHYFGLTKRGEPATAGDDPTQAKLDLIIQEMSKQGRIADRTATVEAGSERALFATPDFLSNIISPILSRHGIQAFTVAPLRRNRQGRPELIVGIPGEVDIDTPTVDDEITEALRDAGLGYVFVLFRPLEIDR